MLVFLWCNQISNQLFNYLIFLAFWLGIQRNPDTGSWFNPYDLSRDFTYFELEVASESQNCAYNFNGDLIPSSCSGSSPCGICQVPKEKVYTKVRSF